MILYGRQDFPEPDILAMVDVLRSDFVNQCPLAQGFEKVALLL